MAFACKNHTLKTLENSYVISDEGAYKLVSVTVQVWFMPINKSLLISDEGVYKLGLVLPFRYGLCYFW